MWFIHFYAPQKIKKKAGSISKKKKRNFYFIQRKIPALTHDNFNGCQSYYNYLIQFLNHIAIFIYLLRIKTKHFDQFWMSIHSDHLYDVSKFIIALNSNLILDSSFKNIRILLSHTKHSNQY